MANTERYRQSALPFLQRKLNKDIRVEKKKLRDFLRVNCVSNVGSITS